MFTTNLEFGRWGEAFGDGDMAAAVLDHIVQHGRPSGSVASRTATATP